eukprot:gene3088-6060_t
MFKPRPNPGPCTTCIYGQIRVIFGIFLWVLAFGIYYKFWNTSKLVNDSRSLHDMQSGRGRSIFHSELAICSLTNSNQQLRQQNMKWDKQAQEMIRNDPLCTKYECPVNSICYLGSCPCKPGYGGENCELHLKIPNPWYFTNCPNLQMTDTLDINIPLSKLGGEYDEKHSIKDPKFCSYLCYSHPNYGTAVVPLSLWKAAQLAEGNLWKQVSQWAQSSDSNDRAEEHWISFHKFVSLEHSRRLGSVIEVGAGPWTQLKGILYVRPDLIVTDFTVWEPGAKRYMEEVSSCSYKSGNKLLKWKQEISNDFHSFPVFIESEGGELLSYNNETTQKNQIKQYDTLISINVIEHVQDAFKYLTGLYLSIKRGGLLIFHDRYYNNETVLDGDQYHPYFHNGSQELCAIM